MIVLATNCESWGSAVSSLPRVSGGQVRAFRRLLPLGRAPWRPDGLGSWSANRPRGRISSISGGFPPLSHRQRCAGAQCHCTHQVVG